VFHIQTTEEIVIKCCIGEHVHRVSCDKISEVTLKRKFKKSFRMMDGLDFLISVIVLNRYNTGKDDDLSDCSKSCDVNFILICIRHNLFFI
jgi:hypothetical protein